ncbi:hypothetical protein ACFY4C_20950 [Actinomadura viridis]|uniref:hypothetical protein n=1 Tax=Actinomadura viridis TaxID=58110 RepID=UPI00369DA1DC
MIPDLNVPSWFTGPIPYMATGGAVLGTCLVLVIVMAYRGRHAAPHPSKAEKQEKGTLENKLTFLVALIIAGVCAQGMGMFFKDKLEFPLVLVIVVGGVLELTAFTCALRARRNVRDPNIGKAGIDGIAVWVVTALSGAFAAMDADKFEVALFRLIMPLLAAWLWERGMAIERRRVRGGSAIHWRVTPERILVWLRIAEPTGRTASEVDAHRRLTRVAKAAKKVRRLKNSDAWAWRLERAEARLERAMESAVAHTGLASDPARQRALLAQIGSLYNATKLAELTPDAPWREFETPVRRTWFEVQGLDFAPVEFAPPQVQVRAEVQEPVRAEVQEGTQKVHDPGPAPEPQVRELESGPVNRESQFQVQEPAPEPSEPADPAVREPAESKTNPPAPEPRTSQKRQVQRTANLPDRASRKSFEVQQVRELIESRGYDEVTLNVVRDEFGFTKTTAYNRLIEARNLVNQTAAS